MRIAVLVKQVPNPDALAAVMGIDEASSSIRLPPGHPLVASPFDEQAIEAALRLRDRLGAEVKISAATLGPESARAVIKHALALGCDDGVHVLDAMLDRADSYTTAQALAGAVRKLGTVDLVLAGRQAADGDAGIVALGVAELLGLTAVTFACEIEPGEGELCVKRVLQDGFETVAAPLPALVTVSNELGEVRKPNLRETMRAARKPIAVWSAQDLQLDRASLAGWGRRTRLYQPPRRAQCEILEGAAPAEQAASLAQRLRDARLV